jgi:GGDEF domain-containing protein
MPMRLAMSGLAMTEDPTRRLVPLGPAVLGATLTCLSLGRLAADATAATATAVGTPLAQSVLPTGLLSVATGSAGILLLMLSLLWRHHVMGPTLTHLILATCVILGTADTVAYTQASGRADRGAELVLLAVAAGGLLVQRAWFAGALASVLLGWVALAATQTNARGLFLIGMLGSAALAMSTRKARLAAVETQVALRQRADMSVLDPLTGLPDQRGTMLVGAQLLAIARREHGAVGCTVVHVVGLDAVRTGSGAVAADALVTHVAQVLRGAVRGTDVVGRWGVDQLVVVAHGPGASLEVLTGRLAEALEPGCPLSAAQWPRRLRLGNALLEPWEDGGLLTTISAARRAMERSLPFDPATYAQGDHPQQRERSTDEIHGRQPQPGGQHQHLQHTAEQIAAWPTE